MTNELTAYDSRWQQGSQMCLDNFEIVKLVLELSHILAFKTSMEIQLQTTSGMYYKSFTIVIYDHKLRFILERNL